MADSEVRVVVIGVDGSPSGLHAAEFSATRVCRKGEDRAIVLAVQPAAHNNPLHLAAYTLTPGDHTPKVPIVPLEANAETVKIAETAAQFFKRAGIEVEARAVVGDPKECLLYISEQEGANLLVVGNRGWTDIHKAVVGSVSEYCVRNAKIPVLAVRSPQSQEHAAPAGAELIRKTSSSASPKHMSYGDGSEYPV